MAKKKFKAKKMLNAVKGPIDYPFLIISLALLSIGLLMVFSASYADAYYSNKASTYYFLKQLVFVVAGAIGAVVCYVIGYKKLAKWSPIIAIASIVLLALVPIMGVGLYDEKRWLNLGFFTLQPSEFAKLAVILYFSAYLATNQKRLDTFKGGLVPFAAVLGLITIFMISQPHYSGALIIIAIAASVMLFGKYPIKWFATLAGAAGAAVAVKVAMTPYAITRIMTLINNPESSAKSSGYQSLQSLYAIGTGGLFGRGFGNSIQKYGFLPEPYNDFIFAVVCEELGFVGALIIIILFALLIWRGYAIALRAPDKLGSLIAAGITTHFALQIVLNLAVVTGLIPVTGVSLPLFSYGGSALIMQIVEIGIMLSISRGIAAPEVG